jgi:hypothetical protein
MLLSLIYYLICRALSAGHGQMDDRDVELLVLRHQVRVLTSTGEAALPAAVGPADPGRGEPAAPQTAVVLVHRQAGDAAPLAPRAGPAQVDVPSQAPWRANLCAAGWLLGRDRYAGFAFPGRDVPSGGLALSGGSVSGSTKTLPCGPARTAWWRALPRTSCSNVRNHTVHPQGGVLRWSSPAPLPPIASPLGSPLVSAV